MQKVLIISYFFPPSNFVGGDRTHAWAQHLSESGIYPIIITRNWNENQKDLVDKLDSNEYSIEKTDKYEVHRMPYKHLLRDRLSSHKWLSVFQKVLTLKELIFSNFFIKSLPYYNFYSEAEKMIQADSEIKIIIASGRPFQSFFIGYRLKKKFPSIKWIPDYRDEWTTHSRNEQNTILQDLISRLESKSELKWTSNAYSFLTVSDVVKDSLEKYNSKSGLVILNGFSESDLKIKLTPVKNELNIIYYGTIYYDQDFSILLSTISSLKEKTDTKIIIHFIGVGLFKDIILNHIKNYNVDIKLIPKMGKYELSRYLSVADLLFLTSYSKTKGIYPVKIFDYYKTGIPILLAPSDKSVMENFIIKSNSGYVANNTKECENILLELICKKNKGETTIFFQNTKYASQFSRKYQTKKLAQIIKNII